jgi:hypothetical protein
MVVLLSFSFLPEHKLHIDNQNGTAITVTITDKIAGSLDIGIGWNEEHLPVFRPVI